jgi:hypothetical protein
MANKFTNFLSGAVNASGNLRDYQHAARLYTDNNFELAPKAGWLYFIVLNINPNVLNKPSIDKNWVERQRNRQVGILAKSADLPRFTLKTEAVNQYNRKTYIQTGITYSPIRITFHDDMANVTTDLWKNYYNYYYADGTYGQVGGGAVRASTTNMPAAFTDNKLNDNTVGVYKYGLNNGQDERFFNSIEIYLLNKKKQSKVTLINPIISAWDHGKVDQTSGDALENAMSINYESVIYDTKNNSSANVGFNDRRFYDKTPSPLSVGGVGNTSLLGENGLLSSAGDLFGEIGSINENTSAASLFNTALSSARFIKNARQISKAGIIEEAYGVVGSTLGNISASGNITKGLGQTVQSINATGVNFFNGVSKATTNITTAVQKKLDPGNI